MKKYFPIVLFCYNRIYHLKKTLNFLKKNINSEKHELIIFSDGPKSENDKKKILNIRSYLNTIKHFKKNLIINRNRNYGLHDNIVKGINKVFQKYEAAIFLEDDIQTNKYFLKNMNFLIRKFSKYKKIGCISGYSYPIKVKKNYPDFYLIKGGECWGWATWSNRWKYYNNDAQFTFNQLKRSNQLDEFNFEKGNLKNLIKTIKNNKFSWAIKWHASLFINKKFTIFPKYPSVNNFGFDATGENCNYGHNIFYNKNIKKKFIINLKKEKLNLSENLKIKNELKTFFINNKNFNLSKITGYAKKLINNYF